MKSKFSQEAMREIDGMFTPVTVTFTVEDDPEVIERYRQAMERRIAAGEVEVFRFTPQGVGELPSGTNGH